MTRSTILIAADVLDRIAADAARFARRKERGGILLGLRRGSHLHVTEATLPMRWDWGTMFSFRRSAAGHQRIALRRWNESARVVDFLGEWHSHPQKVPTPSSIDLASWRRITSDRGAPMVFVIVGYEAMWVGLCIPGGDHPFPYGEVETSKGGIAFQHSQGAIFPYPVAGPLAGA